MAPKRSPMTNAWTAALLAMLLLPIHLECLAAPGAFGEPREPLHFPLVRKRTPQRTPEDYAVMADNIRQKYGRPSLDTAARQKRGNTANVNILNQNADTTYIAPMTVGTPSQTFDVILDTGSSDLWFAGTACHSCPNPSLLFDSSKSSTFQNSQNSITISYGSGTVQGVLGQDTVSLGGFSVTNQPFVVVSTTSTNFIQSPVSGLLGLAFQPLAQTRATPFVQFLTQGNQLTTSEMSFWLRRDDNLSVDPTTLPPQPGGAFTIGGTNSSLFTGSIDFVDLPTTSPSFWFLPLQAVTVRGNSVTIPTGNSALAAIDTGTSLIGGPTTAVKNIYAQIPGSKALSGNLQGYYEYPCSTSISLTFNFGSRTWVISDADFNTGRVDTNGNCLGAVFDLGAGTNAPSGSNIPSWVIGDSFLKNVYSVFRFNPPSVGFAQLSAAAGGNSNPQPGGSTATVTGASNPLPSLGAAFRTVDRPSSSAVVALAIIFTTVSTVYSLLDLV